MKDSEIWHISVRYMLTSAQSAASKGTAPSVVSGSQGIGGKEWDRRVVLLSSFKGFTAQMGLQGLKKFLSVSSFPVVQAVSPYPALRVTLSYQGSAGLWQRLSHSDLSMHWSFQSIICAEAKTEYSPSLSSSHPFSWQVITYR